MFFEKEVYFGILMCLCKSFVCIGFVILYVFCLFCVFFFMSFIFCFFVVLWIVDLVIIIKEGFWGKGNEFYWKVNIYEQSEIRKKFGNMGVDIYKSKWEFIF